MKYATFSDLHFLISFEWKHVLSTLNLVKISSKIAILSL